MILKLSAVSVPEFVDDPVINAVSTPVCAIKLVNVVLAKVEEPVILKLSAVSVPLLVEEPVFREVKFPA